ncbi:MAG: heat-inducible transcriptional repressor HrcA [bacterium]|nr:heat-inducible transcriptional repressor HrcA [Candidatus Margulisiibacteriota bacterium]
MINQELDERKQKILNAIVKDYQHTAEPVGSRTIAKKYLPGISPATIRNEMADLEEEGLIVQPHTSSGRIPTDQGYRFYVNRLMRAIKPTQKETHDFQQMYSYFGPNIDNILHQTAKLLSRALDYTAVVVNIGEHQRVFSAGTSNLLHQPEFRNLSHMQKMLDLLEEEELLTELVEEYALSDEVNIKIGSENTIKEVRECSVIVSAYEFEDERIGGIGIIGPTRMYYSKATCLVDYVAKELTNILSQGDLF